MYEDEYQGGLKHHFSSSLLFMAMSRCWPLVDEKLQEPFAVSSGQWLLSLRVKC